MAAVAVAVGAPTAADEEHVQAPVASWDPAQQPAVVVAGEAEEAVARARAAYAHAPCHDHDHDPARVLRP